MKTPKKIIIIKSVRGNKDKLSLTNRPNTAYRQIQALGLLAREHESRFDKILMKTTI